MKQISTDEVENHSMTDDTTKIETSSMDSDENVLMDEKLAAENWKSLKFFSLKEFNSWFDVYKERTKTVTATRDSIKMKSSIVDSNVFPYQRLHLICSHGQKPRKKGSNIRINQSYMFTGCPFKITLSYTKLDCYQIINFVQEHKGHQLSQKAFSLHPQNRILKDTAKVNEIGKLVKKKVPKRILKQIVLEECGNRMTTQDFINLEKKMSSYKVVCDLKETVDQLQRQQKKDANAFLKVVNWTNELGKYTLKIIFWQSGRQHSYFSKFPSMLFVDGTYNLTDRGYILVPFLIIDNHGKSRLVAWALISQETREILKECFVLFKEANKDVIDKLDYVMLDKDFSEINVLFEVLPRVHFVICSWHASKAVVRYMNSLKVPLQKLHVKEELKNLFFDLLNAPSEHLYFQVWQNITLLGQHGSVFDDAVQYLELYWHNHRENFARCFLKKKEILHSFTNNRSESFNKLAKDVITRQSKIQLVVNSLFELEENQNLSKDLKDWEAANKTFNPTDIEPTDFELDEILKVGRLLVSKEIVKKNNCTVRIEMQS